MTFAANEEGETTHAATLDLLGHRVNVLGELSAELVLLSHRGRGWHRDGDVADVPLGLRRFLTSLKLAASGVRVVTKGGGELLVKVVERGDREHGSVTNGLILTLGEEVGEVREGRGALRGEAGGRGSGRRLGGSLAHPEGPRDGGGLVLGSVSLDVVEIDEVVGLVGATNVGLKSGEADP